MPLVLFESQASQIAFAYQVIVKEIRLSQKTSNVESAESHGYKQSLLNCR